MNAALNNRSDTVKEFAFTPRDFERVRALIHCKAGIALAESKQQMVYSRLARRLRVMGISSFSEYLDGLEAGNDEQEWQAFTNALTTNLTSFFREAHHFPLLAAHFKTAKDPIDVWCSASSTGEEPYSIAMTACEAFNTLTPPVRIIATDIDTNVLAAGANGVYSMDRLDKLAPERMRRFFQKGRGAQEGLARVRPELRKLITFQQLNLLADGWALKGPFDVIFCRNVMIYFDKPTQSKILARFAPLMKHDALLFAGHSENFLYVSDAFKLRGKTVYTLQKSRVLAPGSANR
ncbi:MAG: CheR family methyltransferase [Pseudomonadota bacterium]